MSLDEGICAYLTGGLGNQLFVLAAAWDQAKRLDCPLYIDASKYLSGDLRSFELGSLTLPGEVISHESPWHRKDRRLRTPSFLGATKRLRVYRETSFGYSGDIDKIVPGTTIFGYFQSPRYFERVADQVAGLLLQSYAQPSEQQILDNLARDERITIHVRRGDYLTAHTQAVHGVASGAYFARGLDIIYKLSNLKRSIVFSDEPEVAREELSHISDTTYFESKSRLSTLNTIKAMSLGEGMIMSNSSFSWWAAWLMSRRGEKPIIAPRPWMSSGESAADLLGANWITLDARE